MATNKAAKPADPWTDAERILTDLNARSASQQPEWRRGDFEPFDPLGRGIQALGRQLPEGITRSLFTSFVPQTGPGVAAQAVAGALPLRYGKLAAEKLGPWAMRAGLRALAAGGAGAATSGAMGYPAPIETGVLEGLGTVGGELAGSVTRAGAQAAASSRLLKATTARVTDAFRAILTRWLPRDASDKRVIQSVIADEPAERVLDAINAIRAKHADRVVSAKGLKDYLALLEEEMPPPASAKPGSPVIDLGMHWPEPRTFEGKLPGAPEAPALPGQPALPGAPPKALPGAPAPPATGPLDLVRVGDVYQVLDRAAAEKLVTLPPGTKAGDVLALKAIHEQRQKVIETLRRTIDEKLGDPNLGDLWKEWHRAKNLTRYMRGPVSAGEDIPKALTGASGNLSWDGYQRLLARKATNDPNLVGKKTLRNGQWEPIYSQDELAMIDHALHWDPETGLARGEEGTGLSALWPHVSAGFGRAHLFGRLPSSLPHVARMPGWEQEAGRKATLAPAAVRGILSGVPSNVLSPDTRVRLEEAE